MERSAELSLPLFPTKPVQWGFCIKVSKSIHLFFLLSTFKGISLELFHWSTKKCFYCCHSVMRFLFEMFLYTFQNRTKPTIVGFLWDWNCTGNRDNSPPPFHFKLVSDLPFYIKLLTWDRNFWSDTYSTISIFTLLVFSPWNVGGIPSN